MGDECARTIIEVIDRFEGNIPTAEQLQKAAEQSEANYPNEEGPLPDDLDYHQMVEDINWIIQKYGGYTTVETLAETLNELSPDRLDEISKRADNASLAIPMLDLTS